MFLLNQHKYGPKKTFMECRHFDTRNVNILTRTGHKHSVTMSYWNANIFQMVHGKKYIYTNKWKWIFVRSKIVKSIIFYKKNNKNKITTAKCHIYTFPFNKAVSIRYTILYYYEIQDYVTQIFQIRSTHSKTWLRLLSISVSQYIVATL